MMIEKMAENKWCVTLGPFGRPCGWGKIIHETTGILYVDRSDHDATQLFNEKSVIRVASAEEVKNVFANIMNSKRVLH